MIFNKEERTYWIENYKKFPTSNISDAMDNLGLRSGIVLGLRPLDVYQPRTAGFAKTLRQMRRKTAFDGKSLTKQASIIDSQTEYGDLLVIEATGLTDVATGGAMLATRARCAGSWVSSQTEVSVTSTRSQTSNSRSTSAAQAR
ncbi:hypothetical protein DXA91_07420 [Clostridium sp. OF09-10]|nr:hypothetical protein [Clostridium sp. OF09-10]RHV99080.1 hypothetical protein DXA91_07420 [Clostridium sp. OF09-10]